MFNEDRGANRGEWSELYTFRLFPIRMFSFERFGVQDGSYPVARPAFSAVTLLLRCVVL